MNATEKALVEKIRQLPAQRLAEVENFIDFLRVRDEESRHVTAMTKASEPSFAVVWDNDADAAYDRM